MVSTESLYIYYWYYKWQHVRKVINPGMLLGTWLKKQQQRNQSGHCWQLSDAMYMEK